jgi:pyridoxal 5'-phosphate synthase pdxT subunit
LLIGVLSLQGDFREHILTLESLGVQAIKVRTEAELNAVDGLVIPGGESTAISKLAVNFGLIEPLRKFAKTKPVLGTCAGLIMLSDQVEGAIEGQQFIGGIGVKTSRNAYGGQTHSFEAVVDFGDVQEKVAFIRAPKILETSSAKVIARLNREAVAVKDGNLFGASFHPEITGSKVLHKLFIDAVARSKTK